MRKRSTSLLSSFKHALDGVLLVLNRDRNARIHLAVAICVVAVAIWLHLDIFRWALLWLAIGLVFTAEMLNTTIELLVDLAAPQVHPIAKSAKDVAAGAVLLMVLVAMAIGLLVLGPPLLDRLGMLL